MCVCCVCWADIYVIVDVSGSTSMDCQGHTFLWWCLSFLRAILKCLPSHIHALRKNNLINNEPITFSLWSFESTLHKHCHFDIPQGEAQLFNYSLGTFFCFCFGFCLKSCSVCCVFRKWEENARWDWKTCVTRSGQVTVRWRDKLWELVWRTCNKSWTKSWSFSSCCSVDWWGGVVQGDQSRQSYFWKPNSCSSLFFVIFPFFSSGTIWKTSEGHCEHANCHVLSMWCFGIRPLVGSLNCAFRHSHKYNSKTKKEQNKHTLAGGVLEQPDRRRGDHGRAAHRRQTAPQSGWCDCKITCSCRKQFSCRYFRHITFNCNKLIKDCQTFETQNHCFFRRILGVFCLSRRSSRLVRVAQTWSLSVCQCCWSPVGPTSCSSNRWGLGMGEAFRSCLGQVERSQNCSGVSLFRALKKEKEKKTQLLLLQPTQVIQNNAGITTPPNSWTSVCNKANCLSQSIKTTKILDNFADFNRVPDYCAFGDKRMCSCHTCYWNPSCSSLVSSIHLWTLAFRDIHRWGQCKTTSQNSRHSTFDDCKKWLWRLSSWSWKPWRSWWSSSWLRRSWKSWPVSFTKSISFTLQEKTQTVLFKEWRRRRWRWR